MIAFLTLAIVGCNSGTACDQAREVTDKLANEVCAARDCVACQCLRNHQTFDADSGECQDQEPVCEGARLTEANNCLNDRTACEDTLRSQFEGFVNAYCPAD